MLTQVDTVLQPEISSTDHCPCSVMHCDDADCDDDPEEIFGRVEMPSLNPDCLTSSNIFNITLGQIDDIFLVQMNLWGVVKFDYPLSFRYWHNYMYIFFTAL